MNRIDDVYVGKVPIVPSRLAEPPPAGERHELVDGEVVLGWTDGERIRIDGFGGEEEAMGAAWVAYRTLARRRARLEGRRPLPVSAERLTLDESREPATIRAGGRAIATLVRPGDGDDDAGPRYFGFELRLPPRTDAENARAMAIMTYRTLRRSGIRWAIRAAAAQDAGEAGVARSHPSAAERRARWWRDGHGDARRGALVLAALVGAGAVIALVASSPAFASMVFVALASFATIFALVALLGLVRLVVGDVAGGVTERLRRRRPDDGSRRRRLVLTRTGDPGAAEGALARVPARGARSARSKARSKLNGASPRTA